MLFFVSFSVFSGRARKTPKTEIRHTLHAKTWFFKVRARAAAAPRTTTNRSKIIKQRLQKVRKTLNIVDFSASRGRPPKIPPKRASRAPSGDLPGTPRRLQEAPRALQDGSKSRQERSKSRPGAAPERPWRPLGAGLGPRRPPEASRRPFCPPRGSILAPPGVHFGASGEQKKRQTQEEKQEVEQSKRKRKSKSTQKKSKRNSKSKSNSKGKTKSKTQSTSKRRATSQGQKAARPQGPGGMSGALRIQHQSTEPR